MTKNYQQKYENAFADLVKAPAARATALGRQSLVLLLKALGVSRNDSVGVCAFTCLSVIEAVKVVGANPVYLDIDESLCIAPDSILKRERDSLRVVILQHTFGNPGKLDQLLESCRKINAVVIEDCAHALGCYWKGTPLGQFGAGAIYSFQWGKPYTIGQGGMLTVNSQELLEKVDALIDNFSTRQSFMRLMLYEIERTVFNVLNGTTLDIKLRRLCRFWRDKNLKTTSISSNSWVFKKGYIQSPDMLTVKAGLREIQKWPDTMKMRRQNTDMIEQQFQKYGLPLWPKQKEADITYLRYPIRVSSKPDLLRKASKLSLDLAGWYSSPVHPLSGEGLRKIGYFPGVAVHSEENIGKVVHMPTNRGMTPGKLPLFINLLKTGI